MILQDIETMTDAEKLALVKAIQENVASSKAKQVSLETGQYAKLVVDAIKKIKTDLEERYAEISGDIAVKSAAIRDGKDGINGAKGEKGDTGLRGVDGANGKDGKNGKDGVDGRDGNGVLDARIDFDGSLIITLDNGNEINAGEVVPLDVAEKIKVVGNGGGTSQYVLDLIAALQAQVDSISPTLVITDTFVVGSQAAMLALTDAEKGDVAVRTDLNKTFILTASPYSTLANWQELLTPTDVVTSVAGRTGAVTLSTSDISGLGTIATQAANNVAITGGTVNGTSIGATTASSGAFTYGSTNNVTSTTPALSYNASNASFVNGATVAGSYLQNVMQNKSSAANSSTNFAVSNNLGTDSTYYGEFGMNSSGFSSGTPSDFFSLNNGIYFSGHDGDMSIGSGNGYKTYITWGTSGDKAHVVNASGAIGLNTSITGSTNFGTSGQLMQSAGSAATPTWSSALTGLTIDNSVIGGTTPAAGTFTTLIGGGGSANYEQITGGAAGKAVQFQSLGTDTNISLAVQSKGTGAIDLAAGSSGVNISNGGTVTALTRTVGGVYTTFPSVAISAPTTAGGVQATASVVAAFNVSATIASGGSGYTVGDTLTMVGGTPTSTAGTFTVSTVSAGVVTAVTGNSKAYTVLPTNPVSTTGGTGTGCTLTVSYAIDPGGLSITNAGSGYVEQPTVTFSSGTAAAYATVGSATIIKGLGTSTVSSTTNASIVFQTPNTAVPALVLRDVTGVPDSFLAVTSNTGYVNVFTQGNANASLKVGANGTGFVYLNTNGSGETNQMRVSHTASAVDYLNVTGGTTATKVVTLSAAGSDTDVDIALTPKGAGAVRFGTYTTIGATAFVIDGYITIKDSGGTTRKLAVIV